MPNNHIGQNVDAVAFVDQLEGEPFIIPSGGVLTIQTKNTEYVFDLDAGQVASPRYNGDARINGVTFGGSMLMMNRLLPDTLLEFVVREEDGWHVITTSPIRSWKYAAA